MFLICSLFLIFFGLTYGEDNGLARTPPMGWNSWTKFYCNTNCERYPNDCINENLYKAHADRFVEDGYLAAGYQFVNIDDCWLEMDRDANGLLVANRTRFPNGISGLAQYVHSKGVKLGIYECVGNKTCGGYPGSYGYEEVDAQTFASWGIDYLKYDGCFSNHTTRRTGFTTMSNSLRATGRPIIFSTAWWGADQGNLSAVASISNLQREYDDIVKFWDYGNGSNPRNGSILGIIDHFVSVQDTFVNLPTGPGFWCDPDMIIVGNDQITEDQGRAQMSIWSIWSAPLIMSNDLRNLSAASKEILQNKYVIAVDQDPLGKFGRMVNQTGNIMTFTKPMTPVYNNNSFSYAIALLNRGYSAQIISFVFNNLGLNNPKGYTVMDLWAGQIKGTFKPSDTYTASVNATGVHFIKAIALQ